MATFEQALRALPGFRNDLLRRQQLEAPLEEGTSGFETGGAFGAFPTPLTNVHATGVGIRSRGGQYDPTDNVIKVFVFEKVQTASNVIPKEAGEGIGVDVEYMPIQAVRATPQRDPVRPVVAGLSISPLNANYTGTLGCFLERRQAEAREYFALSNNHVLAAVDELPIGTPIVQPGPERPPYTTNADDAFAVLHSAVAIQFPRGGGAPPTLNRFDAAIASITDMRKISLAQMFGVPRYDPSRVVSPVPGMRVMKMGRTTGFTTGSIIATNIQGTQVNYGTLQFPRIAVFRGSIRIAGDPGTIFSLPGDSGSVILEEATGHPVALLFAGDGSKTTACDLGELCQHLAAWPV